MNRVCGNTAWKGPDSIKHGQGDIRRMNEPQVLITVCFKDTNSPQHVHLLNPLIIHNPVVRTVA